MQSFWHNFHQRESEITTFDDVVASSPVSSQEPLGYQRSKIINFEVWGLGLDVHLCWD